MRERLNNDPKAQIVLVAVLLVAAAFLLVSHMGGGGATGGEAAGAPTEATVAVAGTGVTGTATGATPGEAVENAVEDAENASAEATPSTAQPSATVSSIEAPKLPKPVLAAYEANKTVVLVIVHDGGIDDAVTALAASTLRSNPDVALFEVPASKIYRYAAITLGTEVSRVPALVVVRPRNLSQGIPQATVSYGLQTPQDVLLAVRDGSYHGPGATYHPE
jgi:hypothetical protein